MRYFGGRHKNLEFLRLLNHVIIKSKQLCIHFEVTGYAKSRISSLALHPLLVKGSSHHEQRFALQGQLRKSGYSPLGAKKPRVQANFLYGKQLAEPRDRHLHSALYLRLNLHKIKHRSKLYICWPYRFCLAGFSVPFLRDCFKNVNLNTSLLFYIECIIKCTMHKQIHQINL